MRKLRRFFEYQERESGSRPFRINLYFEMDSWKIAQTLSIWQNQDIKEFLRSVSNEHIYEWIQTQDVKPHTVFGRQTLKITLSARETEYFDVIRVAVKFSLIEQAVFFKFLLDASFESLSDRTTIVRDER